MTINRDSEALSFLSYCDAGVRANCGKQLQQKIKAMSSMVCCSINIPQCPKLNSKTKYQFFQCLQQWIIFEVGNAFETLFLKLDLWNISQESRRKMFANQNSSLERPFERPKWPQNVQTQPQLQWSKQAKTTATSKKTCNTTQNLTKYKPRVSIPPKNNSSLTDTHSHMQPIHQNQNTPNHTPTILNRAVGAEILDTWMFATELHATMRMPQTTKGAVIQNTASMEGMRWRFPWTTAGAFARNSVATHFNPSQNWPPPFPASSFTCVEKSSLMKLVEPWTNAAAPPVEPLLLLSSPFPSTAELRPGPFACCVAFSAFMICSTSVSSSSSSSRSNFLVARARIRPCGRSMNDEYLTKGRWLIMTQNLKDRRPTARDGAVVQTSVLQNWIICLFKGPPLWIWNDIVTQTQFPHPKHNRGVMHTLLAIYQRFSFHYVFLNRVKLLYWSEG